MADKPVVRSVYHFTHLENIASIFKDGALWPDNKVTGSNICADLQIKQKRRMWKVSVEPFGFLGDYTPFYFTPQSPMLAAVATRNTQGVPPIRQAHLAIIRLNFEPNKDAIINGSSSIVTSKHPLARGVLIDKATPDNIRRLVNWNVIYSKDKWSVKDVYPDEWQRLRQAELLIYGGLQIPGANLTIFVRSDAALLRVEKLIEESGRDVNVEVNEKYFHHHLP
jgi:hypothetical protein